MQNVQVIRVSHSELLTLALASLAVNGKKYDKILGSGLNENYLEIEVSSENIEDTDWDKQPAGPNTRLLLNLTTEWKDYKKIELIKIVRDSTHLGLKEAKDFVDHVVDRCKADRKAWTPIPLAGELAPNIIYVLHAIPGVKTMWA